MTPKLLGEDLLVRARRGCLAQSEEPALRRALESSLELRLLFEAGCEFDRESPVLPGDEALLDRLASNIVSRPQASPPPLRRRGVVLGGAAVGVLVATAAAASLLDDGGFSAQGDFTTARFASPSPAPLRSICRPAEKRALGATRFVTARTGDTLLSLHDQATKGKDSSAHATAVIRGNERRRPPPIVVESAGTSEQRSAPLGTAQSPSEREVFAAANLARREGQLRLAITGYQTLLRYFPRSPEAQHARLTLAEIELRRAAPTRALAHFSEYGAGPLAAEAMWGRARALRALGRWSEEKDALATLVRRFPEAPCSAAARERLENVSH